METREWHNLNKSTSRKKFPYSPVNDVSVEYGRKSRFAMNCQTAELLTTAAGIDPILAAQVATNHTEYALAAMSIIELEPIVGSLQAAIRMHAAFELGRRALRTPMREGTCLRNPWEVYEHVADMFVPTRERVVALNFDRRMRLISRTMVSEGWIEGTPVDPREVLRPAISCKASFVILAHNHPSGDPAASASDREVTTRMSVACQAVGVKLCDHLVFVGGGQYTSLAAEGLCP